MRLNNSQRDAFVRAVMQDVPTVDYKEQLRTAIQDYLYNIAPAEVKVLYDNEKLRKYLTLGSVSVYREDVGFTDMYLVPYGVDGNRWGRPDFRIDLSKAEENPALGVIKSLVISKTEQRIAHANLENKLRQTIYSVTTLKQALELMPEFAKYLPEEVVATKQLPAVANLVADLNKAGWPKQQDKK